MTAAATMFADSTKTVIALCVQGLKGTKCKLPFMQDLTSSFGAAGMMLKERTWLADLSTLAWLGILQQHCIVYPGFKPVFLHLNFLSVVEIFDSMNFCAIEHNGSMKQCLLVHATQAMDDNGSCTSWQLQGWQYYMMCYISDARCVSSGSSRLQSVYTYCNPPTSATAAAAIYLEPVRLC